MKVLVFTVVGTAILENEDGKVLWSSDADPDFSETNPNEFLDEEDADVIADYLLDIGKLKENEEVDVEVDDNATYESVDETDDDEEDDDE